MFHFSLRDLKNKMKHYYSLSISLKKKNKANIPISRNASYILYLSAIGLAWNLPTIHSTLDFSVSHWSLAADVMPILLK